MIGLLLIASAANATEVRLRSSAGCAGAMVRLGDVAEILGDDARVAAALIEIPLCPAPAAGSTRVLRQDEVRQLLALSGVERKVAVVTGSESVTITCEATRGASSTAKRPLVAAGVRQAVFESDSEANHKLHPRLTAKPPAAPELDTKDRAEEPVVERGTTVTVQARAAGVRIRTSGKALEPGAIGQSISVELADGKQRVLARVVGPQVVEVAAEENTAALTR
jgi:Chaperone for flagella basal body P-ring formation